MGSLGARMRLVADAIRPGRGDEHAVRMGRAYEITADASNGYEEHAMRMDGQVRDCAKGAFAA